MLDKIEIKIRNGIIFEKEYLFSNKDAYVLGKKKTIDEDYIDRLINIIKDWDNEYGTDSIIDSEEFTITIYEKDKQATYHGKGNYPTNYHIFKELLGELND